MTSHHFTVVKCDYVIYGQIPRSKIIFVLVILEKRVRIPYGNVLQNWVMVGGFGVITLVCSCKYVNFVFLQLD